MYLYASKWVSGIKTTEKEFEEKGFEENERVAEIAEEFGIKRDKDLSDNGGMDIRVEIGYWRKANAIHGFFVDHVQHHRDDQDLYIVEEKHLMDLKRRCEEVLKSPSKADELLPFVKGCCFGDYEYSDYYFEQLKRTIRICDNALENIANGFDIFYDSSW